MYGLLRRRWRYAAGPLGRDGGSVRADRVRLGRRRELRVVARSQNTFLLFFFSSRRRHTRSVSAFLLNRSSDLTENIINGVERPVKAAELFAFTLRVRAGNTDVLTDAEENVRQKLRAEGVM